MGLGLSGVLWLGMAARSAGAEREARAQPVLEIMSPDRGEYSLRLSWPWGAMAVNHVLFDDHRGPFKAVVESTGKRVSVSFDGWGKEPFVASAEKEVRVIYWVAGKKVVEFTAETASGGEVRVRPAGRPDIRGRRVVLGLGGRAAQGIAEVSVGGRAN
jgi:hypothetical protein